MITDTFLRSKRLTDVLASGNAVTIWPHYVGYTVQLKRAGYSDRFGRAATVRRALKRALAEPSIEVSA